MLAVRRESAAGNDTMNMRVVEKILPPSVQHRKESDFRAKVPGIGGDDA